MLSRWDLSNRELLLLLRNALPEKRAVLIEVSTGETFERVHLPGAIHLNLDEVQDWMLRETPPAGLPIVVYSEAGQTHHARQMANFLKASGFREVYVYPGGKEAWREAGLPTESFVYDNGVPLKDMSQAA